MPMNFKWDRRFMTMAQMVASWSKDPSTKVGAVIVDKSKHVLSVGYNGFPPGVSDSNDLYANKEFKHASVIHAEHNAILHCKHDLDGAIIYVTHKPCNHCTSILITKGIKEIIYETDYPTKFSSESWLKESGIIIRNYAG